MSSSPSSCHTWVRNNIKQTHHRMMMNLYRKSMQKPKHVNQITAHYTFTHNMIIMICERRQCNDGVSCGWRKERQKFVCLMWWKYHTLRSMSFPGIWVSFFCSIQVLLSLLQCPVVSLEERLSSSGPVWNEFGQWYEKRWFKMGFARKLQVVE